MNIAAIGLLGIFLAWVAGNLFGQWLQINYGRIRRESRRANPLPDEPYWRGLLQKKQ